MNHHGFRLLSALLLAGAVSACASNKPPTFERVSASPQVVARGGLVQITAMATDPDGDALKYAWASGWTLKFGGDGVAVVEAPDTAVAQGEVDVTVTDGRGGTAKASIAVSTSEDQAPVISAVTAAPAIAVPGATVALTVDATDADRDALTYTWTAPPGWTLTDGSKANATVTAPTTFGTAGLIQVTVDDGQGGTVSGSVLVSTTADQAPVITALDATPNPVTPGGTVALSAAATSPTGNTVSYGWSLSDSSWTLTGADTAAATLTAPSAYADSVIATVTADDGQGGTSTASVVVSTTPDAAPVIAGVTATPSPAVRGMPVTLSAAARDPDGDAITYAWSLVAAPAGSAAALSDPTMASPTFTPDIPGAYTVRLVVTDAGGLASAPADTQIKPTNGTPQAVIAGTAPLAAVMNTDLTLDGSGSSTPANDPLTYRWRVVTSPPRGVATITPVGDGSTATFRANLAGSYTVELDAVDPWGDTGSTTTTIDVAGPSTLVIMSGSNQTATVATDLSVPLVVEAQTAAGTPVPGVPVAWIPTGATLRTGAILTTDATGQAQTVAHLSRIAGPGNVVARLQDQPTAAVTFGFTAAAGKTTSLAVSTNTGTVATGVTVSVRPVDAYGNPTTGNAVAGGQTFRLAASGSATFATTATDGTLVAGGGTYQVDGKLTSDVFDIQLSDKTAEAVSVVISAPPSQPAYFPYSGWGQIFADDAEVGMGAWITAGTPSWTVENGTSKAHGGSRALGDDLTGSDVAVNGWSGMGRTVMATTSQMVKLTWYQDLTVASAPDDIHNCTAQPDFYLTARQCLGSGCVEMPVTPRSGYPITTACSRRAGFGSTQGWERRVADVTDAANGGYQSLEFDTANRLDQATPIAPSHWWVDDLRLVALGRPGTTGTTGTTIRPGPAVKVAWAAKSYSDNVGVLYGQCVNGGQPITVSARILDKNGNVTEDSLLAFDLAWTGSAAPTQVGAGTVLKVGAKDALVQFEQGRASLVLADTKAETVALSLSDPQKTGLTLGSPANATFVTYYCHDNGNTQNWSDTVPLGTYNATEATRACEALYGPGQCTIDGRNAFAVAPSTTCGNLMGLWTYVGFSHVDACRLSSETLNTGYLTAGFWISSIWAGTYYCTNECGIGTPGGNFSVPSIGLNFSPWQ